MFTYPIYKAIKQHLNTIAPGFFFTGQYAKGKTNTVYRVPALYIEMPKNAASTFWGRGIRVIKNAVIKVHYISNAPFHQHENAVQDSALVAHHNALIEINNLMQGFVVRNEHGRLLTQKFTPVGSSELNFVEGHVFSVLSYRTELYNYSMWEGKPAPESEGPETVRINIR
ncbi:hypothetical protein ABDK00_001575 [Niabella insulamsoli]|uniref:hypothetical protein n=1 Tax=Niabella insulamsoli TaxID=3144874 RepID=UPI0031FDF22D